jgi:putative salt-induced outer membrane protein YdiY
MTAGTRLIPLAALAVPAVAAADSVTLTNGDQLSGNVVSMGEGTLVIETDYSGEIELPWDRVANLVTDEPVRLQTSDGDTVNATVTGIEDGRLDLEASETSIATDQLAAINPPEPGVQTRGFVDAAATLARGNTDSESYSASGEFAARTAYNRYTVGGEYLQESDEGEKTAENARVYGRYDRFISQRWFLGANAAFEHDPFRDLDLRSTAGLGVGYQAYEREDLSLALETGVNYVRDNFDEADNDDFAAGRFAVDYRQDVIFGARLFHNSELLPPLGAPDEFVYTSRSGVRLPLVAGINGTVQVNFDFDNDPSPDTDEEDVVYLFKVGYDW